MKDTDPDSGVSLVTISENSHHEHPQFPQAPRVCSSLSTRFLLFSNITLGPVHVYNFLVNISKDKFNRFRKVWHIPHLELGTISQEEYHVSITKKSLHGANLDNIWVYDLCHVFATNS